LIIQVLPGRLARHLPPSSSPSRFTAGASGFLNFSQSLERPDRYCDPSRFDTMPSRPILQAWRNTRSPGCVRCSLSPPESYHAAGSERRLPGLKRFAPQVLAVQLQQVERVHEDVVAFALPATALDHLKPATLANEAERFSGPFGLIRVANKDACTAKSLKWRASVARCLRTPPQVAKPLDFRWPLDAAYATAASLMPLSLALRMARLGLSTATSTGIEPISPPSKEVPPTPHGGGAGYCPRV
jgi:hypothetical protein